MNDICFLKFNELQKRVQLGRTKIYELINEGSFPPPVKFGRASLWRSNEVEDFILNGGKDADEDKKTAS